MSFYGNAEVNILEHKNRFLGEKKQKEVVMTYIDLEALRSDASTGPDIKHLNPVNTILSLDSF